MTDTCSLCSQKAVSMWSKFGLCVKHYKTFFEMHDHLNRINGLEPVVAPPAAQLEKENHESQRREVPEVREDVRRESPQRNVSARLIELAEHAQYSGSYHMRADVAAMILAVVAPPAAGEQPEQMLREEMQRLSDAWLKAGEGWEHDPAGRVVLRHGQVLRDVLKRTRGEQPAQSFVCPFGAGKPTGWWSCSCGAEHQAEVGEQPSTPEEPKHAFHCRQHGAYLSTEQEASCPTCDANPWFNSDIDAGPYGMLGGQILPCLCHRAASSSAPSPSPAAPRAETKP